MDINFHYFAVKVLAVKAGFADKDGKGDAQLVASYSQFVDDYDWFEPFFVYDVPDYARYLATQIYDNFYFFYPVTTGFSFFDYARLILTTYQKSILIPFHFMTKDPLTVVQTDRKRYRVEPVKNGGGTMLNGLLNDASAAYRQAATRPNLIKIGTLLHIFADTYAHQRFSGWWGWENNAYLEDVVDNVTMNNITASYHPDVYWLMPSVGHPNVNTAPDDSNVSFAIEQKYEESESFPYKAHYSRSNPDEFLVGSLELINYLRACLKKDPIDDKSWAALAVDLKKGFMTAEKNVDTLVNHWSTIFPGISFHYSKDDILKTAVKLPEEMNAIKKKLDLPETAMFIGKMSDDFYRYNVSADNIRTTVNPATDSFVPAAGGDNVLSSREGSEKTFLKKEKPPRR
jgi:hypothetical protein